jgi:formate dehydrogenase subunit gamma
MSQEIKDVLRFTLNERIQHFVLMVFVLVLMITGLSLRFAETGFGRTIIDLEGGMASRGFIHRVASVGVLVLWFYHALYVTFTDRGHAQLMAMCLRVQDFKDMVCSIKFRLGMVSDGPRFGQFDFRQKLQYWAVALGVVSMTLTGIILWFESESMAVMPKWVIDLTQIVHSGEGLLIFVVLFIWHLYDAHLRPGVFPMDWTWLTGKLTVEELKARHPLEYDRLFETDSKNKEAKT